MDMFDRIRFLRKKKLHMSQEEFGKSLGVSRSVIRNMELNLLARPEQKEPLVKLICKEFNVNEDWLRTGAGGDDNIFVKPSEEDEIANLVYDLLDPKDDDFYLAVIELLNTYKGLSPESQQVLKDTARTFMENLAKRRGG